MRTVELRDKETGRWVLKGDELVIRKMRLDHPADLLFRDDLVLVDSATGQPLERQ